MQVQMCNVVTDHRGVHVFGSETGRQCAARASCELPDLGSLRGVEVAQLGDMTAGLDEEMAEIRAIDLTRRRLERKVRQHDEIVLIEQAAGKGNLTAMLGTDEAWLAHLMILRITDGTRTAGCVLAHSLATFGQVRRQSGRCYPAARIGVKCLLRLSVVLMMSLPAARRLLGVVCQRALEPKAR